MHKIGTVYKLNITPKFSKKEGEIAGIFAGDGSQYYEPKAGHYENNVHFGGHNYNYAVYVKSLFEGFFKKKFMFREETLGRYRLRTHSKEIYYFFKNYLDYKPQIKHCTVRLKSMNFPREFKIGFLKGFLDTDGNIYRLKQTKKCRIAFYTTSEKLSKQLCKILDELEIKNGVYVNKRKGRNEKPVYNVYVFSEYTDRFINLVKPLKAKAGWAGS
ncbi:MAG TPA: LAGLIDADG family homing endonuclease [Candidatus Nanoarchaeia archaeon]|nr:LAGLIDADG family homing endonuclease [Candidatus Nanoarchaeia archaeon]